MTDLGTLPGSSDSHGYGINNAGQVAGASGDQAFLYSDGVMTNLGAATRKGAAINNSGQITGFGGPASSGGLPQAFLYSNGAVTYLGPPSTSSLTTSGNAVNDSGQVTYASGGPFQITWDMGKGSQNMLPGHAFLYSNGIVTDLGTLPVTSPTDCGSRGCASVGYGINDLAQVVGSSGPFGLVTGRAFIYSDGAMTDLNSDLANSIAATLTDARAINDSGEIVANGGGMAFLLTPVPEQCTLPLIGGAVAVLLCKLRRGGVASAGTSGFHAKPVPA